MPGLLIHLNTVATCPHPSGIVTIAANNARVLVMGQPVASLSDLSTITGCLFQVPVGFGTKPQPCVSVQWTSASRVFVNGTVPVLLYAPASGVCKSAEQIRQGPPVVNTIQQKVMGV